MMCTREFPKKDDDDKFGNALSIVRRLDEVRDRLLDYTPPNLMSTRFEELRIELDRELREIAIEVAKLCDGG
jgi:hypothetical protein